VDPQLAKHDVLGVLMQVHATTEAAEGDALDRTVRTVAAVSRTSSGRLLPGLAVLVLGLGAAAVAALWVYGSSYRSARLQWLLRSVEAPVAAVLEGWPRAAARLLVSRPVRAYDQPMTLCRRTCPVPWVALVGLALTGGCDATVRPRHLPEVLPGVWTLQPHGVPMGDAGTSQSCRKGRSPEADKTRCGSDEDCILTNKEHICASCYCPFAYYAISREALEQELRFDPKGPSPACREKPCGPCGVCGPYDDSHRPVRAICNDGVCRADPPPPGPS
jgi:hypothetical protein